MGKLKAKETWREFSSFFEKYGPPDIPDKSLVSLTHDEATLAATRIAMLLFTGSFEAIMSYIGELKTEAIARSKEGNIADLNFEEKLDLPISGSSISLRTSNRLAEKGIFSFRDLLGTSKEEILKIPNVGEKTLKEIMNAVREYKLDSP